MINGLRVEFVFFGAFQLSTSSYALHNGHAGELISEPLHFGWSKPLAMVGTSGRRSAKHPKADPAFGVYMRCLEDAPADFQYRAGHSKNSKDKKFIVY